MSSAECLREFVKERLSAAAEEIFTVFKQTIVEYEDEIDRQRRLLNIVWKPEIKLHRIELPHVCNEGEGLTEQQLFIQEKNSSLDQEDSDPPQIKEDQEQIYTGRQGEQLELKQETDPSESTPAAEESDHSEDQTLSSHPDKTTAAVEEVDIPEPSEPDSDEQLLSLQVTERQDQTGSKSKTKTQHRRSRHQTNNGPSTMSEVDCDVHTGEKSFKCETCGKCFKFKSLLQRHLRIHTELQHVCNEGEGLTEQQLFIQEKNSSLDQEDSDPPQIKEEQEQIYTGRQGEQLELKQETDASESTPAAEESDHSEDQTLSSHPDKTTAAVEEVDIPEPSEPDSDEQLLSLQVTERQDQTGSKSKTKTQYRRGRRQTYNGPSTMSEVDCDVHTGKKSFKCETCGKCFKFKSRLQTHLRIHTGERPYPCTTCGETFTISTNLTRHMRIHTGERPYSCKTCGDTFAFVVDMKRHMRIHMTEPASLCKTCGKTFSDVTALKMHMKIHTAEPAYRCKICGKTFNYSAHFRRHMRVHTGEQPYLCKICGRTFNYSTNLRRHTRVHMGQHSTYLCKTCGKTFNYSGNFRRHMRIHTGENPNHCEICGRTFNYSGNFRRHMRIHTGENPNHCEICGRTFNYSANFRRHMRAHADEQPNL